MIYYPLTTLMLANIRDILIISTPEDQPAYQNLLGDGQQWGINLSYAEQPSPDGLAQAFIIGEDFIGDDDVCLILGDNILYGYGLGLLLEKACKNNDGATLFAQYVNDPRRYGVITIDDNGHVTDIEEKPSDPKSNFVAIGLYCYDSSVIKIAKEIKPSARGELEITDLNRVYLQQKKLKTEFLGRGFAWFDVGEPVSLNIASQFVETVETRQNIHIACPEEVAFRMEFINDRQLKKLAEKFATSAYGQYILSLTTDIRFMGEK
jgi:glucose-1-phosphate thymidylyltransferase